MIFSADFFSLDDFDAQAAPPHCWLSDSHQARLARAFLCTAVNLQAKKSPRVRRAGVKRSVSELASRSDRVACFQVALDLCQVVRVLGLVQGDVEGH